MTQNTGFFYRATTVQWLLRIFYGLCVLLVFIDFVVHRHTLSDIEKFPAFYVLFGLGTSLILIVAAKLMRKILLRDEDYYQQVMTQYEQACDSSTEPKEKH